MSDYVTVADVKTYLRISGSGDDGLLGEMVTRASRMIDNVCGRWFDVRNETRYYDAVGSHITGQLLILDADLLSLTTLTNGDGTVISSNDLIFRPVNSPPHFGLAITASSGLRWTYDDDPEGAISVVGSWGYALTVPEPIEQAALRLTVWLQRDKGEAFLPDDVMQMLKPYMRLRVAAVE